MTDTTEISFHLEVDNDADRQAIAQIIQERLAALGVEKATAVPGTPRVTGAEVVAIIGVTVLIVRGVREVIEELNKLIPEIKKLAKEVKGVKRALVTVGYDEVPVDELLDDKEKLKAFAEEAEDT